MKKKYLVPAIVAAVVAVGAGGYAAFNSFVGNNVQVESVLDSTSNASTATTVSADKLNGKWEIAEESKVYWSVTTSKETVNFENKKVTGTWNVDVNNPASMTGEGTVDLTALDSGNATRDEHVRDREDLLAVKQYPQATFVTKSFTGVPKEWKEGTKVPLTIEGTLKVKGKDKDVTFESEAMYKGEQLLLSGKTKVTFADFGMKSPHTIVLEAENDLGVQLELVLNKK
jgi:polyisoprenoid-binding protein YceI